MQIEFDIGEGICNITNLNINGIDGTVSDFIIEDDGFCIKSATDSILDKYDITFSEYDEVCQMLKSTSFLEVN